MPLKFSPNAVGSWLLLLAIVLVLAFWPTLVQLNLKWTRWDEAYAHGYIAVSLALYMAFILSLIHI